MKPSAVDDAPKLFVAPVHDISRARELSEFHQPLPSACYEQH